MRSNESYVLIIFEIYSSIKFGQFISQMLSQMKEVAKNQENLVGKLQSQQVSQRKYLSQSQSTFQSASTSNNIKKKTEARYFPKQSRILISKPQNSLCYFAVSTEPSRQFEAAKYLGMDNDEKFDEMIEIKLVKSSDIVLSREKFCILGYNLRDNVIKETIKCKTEDFYEQKIEQKNKILYISRNTIQFIVNGEFGEQQFAISHTKVTRPHELKSQQIQTLLKYVKMRFGSFYKISSQKNYLIVEFNSQILNQTYLEQINPFIFSKNVKTARNPKLTHQPKFFKYYTVTMHRPIFSVHPVPLIQFPPQTKILFLQLINNWIVLATKKEVAFLHIDAPLDNLLMIPDLEIKGINILSNDMIVLMEDRSLHVYEFTSRRKPKLVNQIRFRNVEVHAMCNLINGDCLISGIDYSFFMNNMLQQKYVHLLKGMQNIESKSMQEIKINKSMYVCNQNKNYPLKNLTPISVHTFLCTCDKTVYLCQLQTQSVLAKVELKSSIKKIREINYPLNIANVLVLVHKNHTTCDSKKRPKYQNGLIRIGFDEHQGCIGTQVQNIKANSENIVDFQILGDSILSTNGRSIIEYNGLEEGVRTKMILDELLKEKRVRVDENDEDDRYTISRVVGRKNEIVFSAQKQHLNGVYLLER